MKCEETQALIEEYFDGELRAEQSESVATHIARCISCREVLESLEIEQEAVFRAQLLPEPSPLFWTRVEARIASDRAEQARANPESRRTFQRWLDAGWFTPAFASAVLLVLFSAVFGIGILRRSISRTTDGVRTPAKDVVSKNTNPARDMTNDSPNEPSTFLPVPTPGKSISIGKNSKSLARLTKSNSKQNPLFGTVSPEDLVAINSESNSDEVVFQPASINAGDLEISRHVERVSMLMRSFRNAKLVGDQNEIAFERNSARDLLSQNMFLRRNSEAAGDTATVEALNAVEPILLDIANLDKQPTKADVNTIKDRIEKDDIVAALQVR